MKAVSPLVGFVLTIFMTIMITTLTFTVIKPTLERNRGFNVINEASVNLELLSSAIKEVATEAEGSKRTITLSVSDGEYLVDKNSNNIIFTFEPSVDLGVIGRIGDKFLEKGLVFFDFFNSYLDNSLPKNLINVSGNWRVYNNRLEGVNGTAYYFIDKNLNGFYVASNFGSDNNLGEIFVSPVNLSGLVLYLTFDEGSGNIVYDYSGNSRVGYSYFSKGDIINSCESLDYWDGPIALDSSKKVDGNFSIIVKKKPAIGEWINISFNPPGTWNWSTKSGISFYNIVNISGGSNFNIKRVCINDSSGNWGCWNIGFYYTSWSQRYHSFSSYSLSSPTLPDLSRIDSIIFTFNASTTDDFEMRIDRIEVIGPEDVRWSRGVWGNAIQTDEYDYVSGVLSHKWGGVGYEVSFSSWINVGRSCYQSITTGTFGYAGIATFDDHWRPWQGIEYIDTDGDNCADRFYLMGYYYNNPLTASQYLTNFDSWIHYVLIFKVLDLNIVNLKMYKDGKLFFTTNITSSGIGLANGTTTQFNIGRNNAWRGQYFNGTIDEVMIFNRSLTDDEIKFLYQEGLKKLKNSGMIQFNSQIKPYIAISNPSGKIYVENLRVGNQNSKEIKLIKPFYDLEFDSNFRFSKGNHQIKIENIGFNSTSKRPIIRISES